MKHFGDARPNSPALLLACLATASVLAFPASSTFATSSGPQPGMTGAPAGGGFDAEMTCTSCHAAGDADTGGGTIELEGVPAAYEPGKTYTLTLRLAHSDPERARWGFQLTAISSDSFEGIGEFTATDPLQTQVVTGPTGNRSYVEHSYAGTGIGTSGKMSWSFDWTAPDSAAGDALFFGAGNVANLDGSQLGDVILSPSPEPLARAGAPAKAAQ